MRPKVKLKETPAVLWVIFGNHIELLGLSMTSEGALLQISPAENNKGEKTWKDFFLL